MRKKQNQQFLSRAIKQAGNSEWQDEGREVTGSEEWRGKEAEGGTEKRGTEGGKDGEGERGETNLSMWSHWNENKDTQNHFFQVLLSSHPNPSSAFCHPAEI